MIYSSLDSSHWDESNDSKIIPIGAIFAEIAIFAKIIAIFAKISGQIGSGQLSDPTRYFGSVRVGYPDHGSKFGALVAKLHEEADLVKAQNTVQVIVVGNQEEVAHPKDVAQEEEAHPKEEEEALLKE